MALDCWGISACIRIRERADNYQRGKSFARLPMSDYDHLTKDELLKKLHELRKVLDRRPEARFARWVENIAFLLGVLVIVASVLNIPWIDASAFELGIVVTVLVAPKIFGKTVAVDLVGGLLGQVGSLAKTISKKKNGE